MVVGAVLGSTCAGGYGDQPNDAQVRVEGGSLERW